MTRVLAFDFGASSGRAILGSYGEGRLEYREIHRFENIPHTVGGHLRWNYSALMSEVRCGIEKAGAFDSVGIDTWGVDFGLLDADGKLLEDPVHYRDARTEGMVDAAARIMAPQVLYTGTGTQILPINTLFQLLALQKQQPKLLQRADKLLFMPDLFAYALCGHMACERSIASTSQLLTLPEGGWNTQVLRAYNLPERLFLPTVPSGSVVGTWPHRNAKVVAVAGHDTQCAVAALPTQEPDVAFLSCGTWSLLGCELDTPVLTEESLCLGLSNELGANGRVNYLKNIIGLWLIQESRREWRRQGRDYSYAELERLALEAAPLRCFIDPDDPVFTPPGDIPTRVRDYCASTKQYVPQTVGEVMRCVYESLALKYRLALEQLQTSTGRHFTALHILGGGTKDGLLCRMTADSTGLRVVAGPVEATALGNIIIQLVALGALPSIEAGRALITRTETMTEYTPADTAEWDSAYETYKALLKYEK